MGVDRATLDVAIELGILHGGWVPKVRLTEEDPLPRKYRKRQLIPTPSGRGIHGHKIAGDRFSGSVVDGNRIGIDISWQEFF